MIDIECPNCKVRYRVPESRIPKTGTGIRCLKCQNVFLFRNNVDSDSHECLDTEPSVFSHGQCDTPGRVNDGERERRDFSIKIQRTPNGALADNEYDYVAAQENLIACPKCRFRQNASDTCIKCGIIFSKYYEYEEKKQYVEREISTLVDYHIKGLIANENLALRKAVVFVCNRKRFDAMEISSLKKFISTVLKYTKQIIKNEELSSSPDQIRSSQYQVLERQDTIVSYEQYNLLLSNIEKLHAKLKNKELSPTYMDIQSGLLRVLRGGPISEDLYSKAHILIGNYIDNNSQDIYSIVALLKQGPIAYLSFRDPSTASNLINYIKERISMLEVLLEYDPTSRANDYHEMLKEIDTYTQCKEFIVDIEKIKKVLESKGYHLNYLQIIALFSDIQKDRYKAYVNMWTEESFKCLNHKLKGNINKLNLVKDFLQRYEHKIDLPFLKNLWSEKKENQVSLELGYDLTEVVVLQETLHQFNLHCDNREVIELIGKAIEEIDLERFEKGLSGTGDVSRDEVASKSTWTMNGNEFETYVSQGFKKLGYAVYQTQPSNDQGADLVVQKNGKKVVVQVKRYSGKVGNKAIQEVVAAKAFYKAEDAIVVTNSEFTRSAVELALNNKVELWDGLTLRKMFLG